MRSDNEEMLEANNCGEHGRAGRRLIASFVEQNHCLVNTSDGALYCILSDVFMKEILCMKGIKCIMLNQ